MHKFMTCPVCKKEFEIPNWRLGKAKYCSPACAVKAKTSSKSYDKPRKCVGCGASFFPTHWYQKYCSKPCFYKTIKKTKELECKNCGKKFRQVRIAQVYCSRACGTPYKDRELVKPTPDKLDALWAQCVKLEAGGKCEYCGKEDGLNSHHIFSRSNKSLRWDLSNGVSLCVYHHIFGLFSAHKSPVEFIEWLKEKRGNEWYQALRLKAKTISLTKQKITANYKAEINKGLRAIISSHKSR